MDKTETYIKQCEKAEEIQKLTLTDDDYVLVKNANGLVLYEGLLGFHKEPFFSPTPVHFIHIPTQDQLQEMFKKTLAKLVYDFISFCDRYEGTTGGEVWGEFNKYTQQFVSMEQLWLAFMMKERYNKIWSAEKEDWVIIGKE